MGGEDLCGQNPEQPQAEGDNAVRAVLAESGSSLVLPDVFMHYDVFIDLIKEEKVVFPKLLS